MSTVQTVPARFVDPPDPPVPQTTVSRWDQFLGSIASGTPVDEAMLKHYVKRKDIEAVTRSNPLELQRYREAKLAGLRSHYSLFDLDEFFNRVAMGTRVKDAFVEVFGMEPPATFYEILREDAELAARYSKAMETKAILESEKVLDIVDDKDGDILDTGTKGLMPNTANVQRAKLQSETRLRLMGSWYRRQFGDDKGKVELNVNVNHVEVLESARERAKNRGKISPAEKANAVEAAFTPAPDPGDTSWMDDKPTETVWREEQ